MIIKEHEKRFGLIAVGKGFITLEQLIKAMQIQVTEDVERLKHRLIGEILIEMDAMNSSQIMEVLNSMDNRDVVIDKHIKVRE